MLELLVEGNNRNVYNFYCNNFNQIIGEIKKEGD